ncbi:carbohydrate ABC transporter permease [Paenibacillus nasutitermitis]|uniref:Sugar ABC transporter permease n=1 Tax=Paenibacillus nasutitermitis TaxID=1652958 RepID=A0A916YL80_9BACL|nr:carbohydrate ABC transporter permease [Paenibacillus nasutitermitis]GGD49707.1 sugar ABC transporter permease [Paenibacillus nasutitermitis]
MKIKERGFGLTLFNLLNYTGLTIFFIICIYPFYYIFIYSISDPVQAQKGIALLPAGITINNYIEIFQLRNILNSFVVSVLRTVIGAGITVLCCSLFAYIVSKDELPYKKIIYRFVIITMYFNAGIIPYYLTMKMYHLNNNFLLYIIPTAISAFYVILLKTFMEQLPAALEESAKIDGAGYFTIFVKIIFPISTPIVATIAVFAAVNQWNSFIDNFLLVQSLKLKTLQLVLFEYFNQASQIASASKEDLTRGTAVRKITPETIRMTITMVVTLPIIFVYPFMQRYFVKGLILGAVKG